MAKLSPEERAKDIISYRIILIFTAALLSILALIPLGRYADSPGALLSGLPLVKVLIGIGVLAIIGSVVLTVLQKKSGKPAEQRLFLGIDLTVGSVFFLACMIFLYFLRAHAVKVLYFAFPAACVLAIIYYIYQREFTLTSLYTAFALLFLYFECYCRQNSRPYQAALYAAIAVLGGLILLCVTVAASKKGGKLFGVRLCDPSARLLAPVVMPAVVLITAAVAYFKPAFLPLMFVVLVAYLVMLVGYTVKLPNN
ncbi:MAG: hypothetical protein IJC53_00885 [Clostridia bacterium]|nr:hypothetical protein [Clostridia bacterium]